MNAENEITRYTVITATFALIIGAAIVTTHALTRDRIRTNEMQLQQARLAELLDGIAHNNDPHRQMISVQHPLLGKEPQSLFVAQQNGKTEAIIIGASTESGYNGTIELMLAVRTDGSVNGIRITRHRETPGLGDAIELSKSDWSGHFTGRSLNSPKLTRWLVRHDGGDFDQITGATITSRAVVEAVRKGLQYYRQNRETFVKNMAGGE